MAIATEEAFDYLDAAPERITGAEVIPSHTSPQTRAHKHGVLSNLPVFPDSQRHCRSMIFRLCLVRNMLCFQCLPLVCDVVFMVVIC